ncbi:MAG: SDR family NAD(P)-dependent oxidoreductase, partial [Anaerolineales bacterium]|nr:SDR family NAD(P)-dependent oxidoreductase [Anaerolineales bacterium]
MFHFDDKVVMITGASGNLGSAVAQVFRAGGARLALVDRHRDLIEEAFPDLVAAPDRFFNPSADLTSPEAVQTMVQQTV